MHDAFLKEAESQDKLKGLLKILWTSFSSKVTESYAETIIEQLASLEIQKQNLTLCQRLYETKNISDQLRNLVEETLNLKL